MRKLFLLVLAIMLPVFYVVAQVTVQQLSCENLNNPLGIDELHPVLSWQLASAERVILQRAYEVRVGTSLSDVGKGKRLVWASGKVVSDQSVHVVYGGGALLPGEKYYWQVRVWDNKGRVSAWSVPGLWQMGLLQAADWKGSWITSGLPGDSVWGIAPMLRKKVVIDKKIVSATIFITAHGLYEAQINGQRVGDAFLTPGWTSYNKRLQYQVYDVTELLKTGRNAIGVTLGSGWYRGQLGWYNAQKIYGSDAALLLQLQVQFADGTNETIVSDGSWKAAKGGIVYSEIYKGEMQDGGEEKVGWAQADYDDGNWSMVKVGYFDKNKLIATINEPVKQHEVLKPVKVFRTPKGEQVIDFGQNMVGWVAVRLKGKRGDTVTLSHAEILDKAGNFYTENLRGALAKDRYILKGSGEESFAPHFTWHGFRYVKVEGLSGPLDPADFEGVVLYSGMRPTGDFSTSDTLINQLQHNIQWGQRGNFLDVPTDCPQRDERLGWTGDAQVFFRTAAFNYGVEGFFSKWMKDVAADQDSGSVPWVIPNVLWTSESSAGWADVATVVPWNMYLLYGDRRVLEHQYASMKAYVEFIKRQSRNDLWNTGSHYGDWLFYRPTEDLDGRTAVTDKYLIAQCFYAYSTQLLINAARVLGNEQDVRVYGALLAEVKAAFLREYVTPNGRMVSGTQTAYVLALNFDLLPEELRAQAANRLVANIAAYGNHLTTGFLGTPYLCKVLTRFGHTDVAYRLLMQQSYPSWLYPVKMGATTIWERWDGIKLDGETEDASMNSYNHYAYGAIGEWMYGTIGGIQTDTTDGGVGYKRIVLKPYVGGGLTHAEASLETPYGRVLSRWMADSVRMRWAVEVPANTTATVYVPAASMDAVTEGGRMLIASEGVEMVDVADGWVRLKVGSGKYVFDVTK